MCSHLQVGKVESSYHVIRWYFSKNPEETIARLELREFLTSWQERRKTLYIAICIQLIVYIRHIQSRRELLLEGLFHLPALEWVNLFSWYNFSLPLGHKSLWFLITLDYCGISLYLDSTHLHFPKIMKWSWFLMQSLNQNPSHLV